jgi:hypothetical protein
MVINNLHTIRIGFAPDETDPILIVYPDAVLIAAISFKFFQSQAWPCSQVTQPRGGIKQYQFFYRDSMQIRRQRIPCRLCIALIRYIRSTSVGIRPDCHIMKHIG